MYRKKKGDKCDDFYTVFYELIRTTVLRMILRINSNVSGIMEVYKAKVRCTAMPAGLFLVCISDVPEESRDATDDV